MKRFFIIMILFCILPSFAWAETCTFEGTDYYLSDGTHFGGAGSDKGNFSWGNYTFQHEASTYSWSGFLYSAERDTKTPGFTNQYSAITGYGYDKSSNYAVAYIDSELDSTTYAYKGMKTKEITLSTSEKLKGLYMTNTTYAYLSMKSGDSYAKKFGGDSGNDKDYYKVIIEGIDENGASTGTKEFYLADFRYDDNSNDYIVDSWQFVSLSSLGKVKKLKFTVETSDVGQYGPNTPSYFAIDNIEPDDGSDDAMVTCFISSLSGDMLEKMSGSAYRIVLSLIFAAVAVFFLVRREDEK